MPQVYVPYRCCRRLNLATATWAELRHVNKNMHTKCLCPSNQILLLVSKRGSWGRKWRRTGRIPNFPCGLSLGRKLQLSFGLSLPFMCGREMASLHPYAHHPPVRPSGLLVNDKKLHSSPSSKLHAARRE